MSDRAAFQFMNDTRILSFPTPTSAGQSSDYRDSFGLEDLAQRSDVPLSSDDQWLESPFVQFPSSSALPAMTTFACARVNSLKDSRRRLDAPSRNCQCRTFRFHRRSRP
jgi:hypothetical protein